MCVTNVSKMIYEFKNLKKVKLSNGRVGISFSYNEKRSRFFNGNVIGSNINPNTCEEKFKENQLEILYFALLLLWTLDLVPSIAIVSPDIKLASFKNEKNNLKSCFKALGFFFLKSAALGF